MDTLKKLMELGFNVSLVKIHDKEKIRFKYRGDENHKPDVWHVREIIKEIRENREAAIIEIKKMKSGEILNGLLPRNIRISDAQGDN